MENTILTEFLVDFRYNGDGIDPIYITEVLGIKATTIRIKGQVNEKHPPHKYPHNFWSLNSMIEKQRELPCHLIYLLDILSACNEKIDKLYFEGYNPKFVCGIFPFIDNIDITINVNILRRISDLHASLVMCYYKYEEE